LLGFVGCAFIFSAIGGVGLDLSSDLSWGMLLFNGLLFVAGVFIIQRNDECDPGTPRTPQDEIVWSSVLHPRNAKSAVFVVVYATMVLVAVIYSTSSHKHGWSLDTTLSVLWGWALAINLIGAAFSVGNLFKLKPPQKINEITVFISIAAFDIILLILQLISPG
jgi:heme/copper-type cytochrome/quinol oxidase subunit 2